MKFWTGNYKPPENDLDPPEQIIREGVLKMTLLNKSLQKVLKMSLTLLKKLSGKV